MKPKPGFGQTGLRVSNRMKVPSWILYGGVFLLLVYTVPIRWRTLEGRRVANQELYAKIQSEGGLSSPTFQQFLFSLVVLMGLLYLFGAWR